MRPRLIPTGFVALLVWATVACGSGSGRARLAPDALPRATSTSTPSSSTTAPSTTSTIAPAPSTTRPLRSLPTGGPAGAVVTPSGVVMAVTATTSTGWRTMSPCDVIVDVASAKATPITGAHVVLDPGHGGKDEPGSVGPNDLTEARVNYDVALRAKAVLEAHGVTVAMTRMGDYRSTLASRAAIAKGLQADAFVSIHHNAAPDTVRATPGSEVFYQVATGGESTARSRRLAGLVYEEVVAALAPYATRWGADLDAGAKTRVNDEGTDYYGILRNAAGVPSVLAELSYLSTTTESALLATESFRQVEADAVARGIERFLRTDDPGSGFVTAYPRLTPAGGGGNAVGCTNPAFG
jgi:N-acetylmuramoyl-L-alanine amidase